MYHPDLSIDQASYRSAYDHVFCDLNRRIRKIIFYFSRLNLETQDDVSSIEEFRYLSRGDVDQRLANSGHHPAEIPTSVLQQELTRDSYRSVSPLATMQPLRRSTRLCEMQLRRHELQMAARDVPVTPVASRRRRRSN